MNVELLSCLIVSPALKSAVFALSGRSVASLILPHRKSPRFLAGKKKDSRMSPFLPLCVQHSKGFPPGIVQARLKSGHSAESLRY